MFSSRCPRLSPTLSLSITTNLDPVHRGANLDLNCGIHLDFHCGANLDFCRESNLDFIAEQIWISIVEQIWISNIKCVMYLCQIVLQMHAPKHSHAAFTLCKILLHFVNGHDSSCSKSGLSHGDQKKYGFWTRHLCILYQSLVSSVASQGGQDLRGKPFRFLSQRLSDFCKISLKICRSQCLEFLLERKWEKTVLPVCGAHDNWDGTQYMSTLLYLVAGV